MMNRYILCLLHVDPRTGAGGLLKYVGEELALCRARGISGVVVFPFRFRSHPRLDRWASRYWGVLRDGRWEGFHTADSLMALMAKWQRKGTRLIEVQLHHLAAYRLADVEDFLRRVPVLVRLFLHDFSTSCKSSHRFRNGDRFCGEEAPSAEKCNGCSCWDPEHLPNMRRILLGLKGRLTVVAPSASAARIWRTTYPEFAEHLCIVPHWIAKSFGVETANVHEASPLHVGFAGAIARHKGWETFEKLAADMMREKRPYQFYRFGTPAMLPDGIQNVDIRQEISGTGQMTKALRDMNVDIIVSWTLWPETYSYVLFECLQAGVMMVTNAGSGNIADVVHETGCGVVLDNEEHLLEYFRDEPRVRADLAAVRWRPHPLMMEPNAEIVDAFGEPPDVSLPPGRIHRAMRADGLYCVKRWKERRHEP